MINALGGSERGSLMAGAVRNRPVAFRTISGVVVKSYPGVKMCIFRIAFWRPMSRVDHSVRPRSDAVSSRHEPLHDHFDADGQRNHLERYADDSGDGDTIAAAGWTS